MWAKIAVFGTPLPTHIDDDTAPAPTLSYGAHKRACELLIDDCSRRGYVDGRNAPTKDWPMVAGDWGNGRYSQLTQVNAANADLDRVRLVDRRRAKRRQHRSAAPVARVKERTRRHVRSARTAAQAAVPASAQAQNAALSQA